MTKLKGLTTEQVDERIKKNLINHDTLIKSKSILEIIKTNTFTLFNLINVILAILVFFTGEYKNMLFLGVMFSNITIGIIQELKAKRTIDKLKVITDNTIKVVRDSNESVINIHEIVIDDIIKFEAGKQVNTDSEILEGEVLVNESFINGEVEPKIRKKGDKLLSGSFIISGAAYAVVTTIGDDNYTAKITSGAKYIKKPNSVMMNTINKIVKVISLLLIPVGILMFRQQYLINSNINEAIVNSVAALIGLIPEGLVLLTSVVLIIDFIKLSRKNVLVQELYCIETLARVDVICLDKTGTITEGKMILEDIEVLSKDTDLSEIEKILAAISSNLDDNNQTIEAIRDKYNEDPGWEHIEKINFNSENKYSGIKVNKDEYLIGAPGILTNKKTILNKVNIHMENYRVLILTKNKKELALLLISDKVRENAKDTLDFFKKQGVLINIISGDDPKTICKVASTAGMTDLRSIDMSTLKEINYDELITLYNIYGRVNPIEKQEIIKALKRKNHTVAFMGDGVNDVLALKESDVSISINSGTDAAKNVANIILLDDDFANIPIALNEGRQTINNIELSASLYMSKVIYAFSLVFIVLLLNVKYPFIPIQLTLINATTIGIPSFFLGLQRNDDIVSGNFLKNILKYALPTGLLIGLSILTIHVLPYNWFSTVELSVMSYVITAFISFVLLYRLSVPFNRLKKILFVGMSIIFIMGSYLFNDILNVNIMNFQMIFVLLGIISINVHLLKGIRFVSNKFSERRNK